MFVGIIIVIIGVLFLVQALNPNFQIDFGIVWPVLVIVLAIYWMIKEKKISFGNILILFLGIWFLGMNIGWIADEYTKVFWPTILILFGISLIVEALRFQNGRKKHFSSDKKGLLTYHGVFGGVEEIVKTDDFKGATIYSVFGGVDLDLRKIKLKDDVYIYVYSIFGGTSLMIPEGYNVSLQSSNFFGGNENKCQNEYNSQHKTIHVYCVSIFGGTDLK